MLAHRLRAPLALALACSSACAVAQVAINGSIQNFDTLAATGTGSTLPPGWAFVETGTNAETTYAADNGANQSGNTYSYGATGSSERAFGMLLSGSLVSTIGVHLQNAGGTPITSLEVAYTGEQWRFGATGRPADRIDFQYSTNATSLSTGTWTDVDALDFTSPIASGAVGPLDGNLAANRVAISGTITGLNLAPGASLWVRWTDVNIAPGADDGLALDDVRFGQAVDTAPTVASTSPLPGATVALNANLTVNFSEAVTVSNGWFALDCGAGTPALTASGGPVAYTLTHAAPLPSGANCTLTIDGDLVQDQDGPTLHTLGSDHVLAFSTVVDVPPTIAATVPEPAAIDVARGADLQVTFSEAVTAESGAFALECPDGTGIAAISSTEDGVIHVIDPSVTLPAATDCVLRIDAGKIADQDGVVQALSAGADIGFRTAAVAPPVVLSTVPADNASNFPAAGELAVTFDQSVTASPGAFTLGCDTTADITLTHGSSGTAFALDTGTSLADGESCTLHIEADHIVSDDGLQLAADVDIVFAVAASGPGTYYATVNASSPGQLRCTLNAVIDGHVKYPYSTSTQPGDPNNVTDTWDILNIADQDPSNSGRVVDIYRNESYTKHNAGNNDYNREHTWPNSLGFPDQQQLAAYTDTHMLYISNDTYNSTRGNTPYGNCTSGCTTLATLATNGRGGTAGEVNKYNGGNIFEVWSGRKGDAARAVMYMAIRYEGGDGTPDLELTNNLALVVGTSQTAQKAYMGKLDDLIAWHQADPPDAQELLRNEAVAVFQGNRNPFIDHPEWGTKALFESTTPATCEPLSGGSNVPPVADDDLYAPTEDTVFNQPAPGVLDGDTDANGQALTAVRMADVQHGSLTLAPNGSFTYTPALNYCGADGFSYQARDGSLNSATALVTLAVACVNDAPVANDATFALAENSPAGTAVGTVVASDVDAGDTLSYLITAGNTGNAFTIGAGGAITVNSAAALDFEATPSFALTVTVSDSATPAASDTAAITVELSNLDEGAAVANPDAVTATEDTPAAFDVLANDVADPDGGALVVTGVGAAAHGSAGFTASQVTYTPAADYCGADSVSYTIGGGASAQITIDVVCVNDAPVANDATVALAENSAAGTAVGSVVASDVDGDTLDYVVLSGNESGAFAVDAATGAVTVADAAPLDYETTMQFVLTVRVVDSGVPAKSDDAIVTIDLTNVDEGTGLARDDTLSLLEDAPATTVDVLANDDADPDGDALQVIAVSTAQHGTTSFTAGSVSYAPDADYCGADSFTYTVTGGDVATVAVTVGCVVDVPEVTGSVPDRVETLGKAVGFSIAGAFSSPDAMVFRAEGLPPGLTAGADGNVAGTPTAPGSYEVTAFAESTAGSVSTSFTITVLDLPIFGDGFED